MTEDWRVGGFGLYIHWPFCAAKCPYCDFNSHVAQKIDQPAWKNTYLEEIARYRSLLPDRVLNSVFFGGGTPSLMEPDTVAAVIEAIKKAWPIANDLEITLEANPGSVEASRFSDYAAAGINRISMGIQALNDQDLKRLGRLHSATEAKQAFEIARKYFNRVSFDLIYARQEQTTEEWRKELHEALSMAVDHLSLYQLTIEPGTAFGDRYARGKLAGLPTENRAADMYEVTQETCAAAGMPAYEVSNHAVPGAESRHNLIYWRYGDYIGIGPGAHGRITHEGVKYATEAWSDPHKWLFSKEKDRRLTPITSSEIAAEMVMMGLRLSEGIDMDRYALLNNSAFSAEAVSHLKSIGMIETNDRTLSVTPSGRLVLNSVIQALLN